jgi:excisionase family DNA binding protein
MAEEKPILLTAAEVAARLRVTKRTVQRWAMMRRIPAYRLSHKAFRFDWDKVLAALADQESESPSKP